MMFFLGMFAGAIAMLLALFGGGMLLLWWQGRCWRIETESRSK